MAVHAIRHSPPLNKKKGAENMAKIVPTIQMVLEKYPKIAAVERLRMGKPGKKTVRNMVVSVARLCKMAGIDTAETYASLTRKRLTKVLDHAIKEGLKAVTIWSYLNAVKAVMARWTHSYYADAHWAVPTIELPSYNRQIQRYIRPDKKVLAKVKKWYASLVERDDNREWVAATLMLEFAMRNGDVERLRWSDFREKDGGIVLCYVPHKTALSSGRRVAWPVHPDIWEKLSVYRDTDTHQHKRKGWSKLEDKNSALVVPCARDVFVRLNKDLRTQKIFTGPKGCYELRKICIDHVYQKFGAEMASSISGDDIRTMMRYYADPSQPNIGDLRIIDLI